MLIGIIVVILVIMGIWRFAVLPWLISQRDLQNAGKVAPNPGIPPSAQLVYPTDLSLDPNPRGAPHYVFPGKD